MILINVSDYCRISLGEYCAACDPDAVFSSVESVPDVLLSEQIFSEGLSLCSDPFERQTAGDVDISIVDVFTPQFSGYSRQCQDVVVFVDSFIRDELLVPLADLVPLSIVLKGVAVEYRLSVAGDNSCRCHGVCSFDVAVAVIYGDDLDSFDFSHITTPF